MKSIAFVLISLVAAYGIPAAAQTFKCTSGGKTVFSDQPCGNDAKKISAVGGNPDVPSAQAGSPKETGAQNCKAKVVSSVTWLDPESVRIGDISGGEMELLDYADQKVASRRYSILVNAKNASGGYVGERSIVCSTSQDGMRILKLDTSKINRSTRN
jgi:hypothetical protein